MLRKYQLIHIGIVIDKIKSIQYIPKVLKTPLCHTFILLKKTKKSANKQGIYILVFEHLPCKYTHIKHHDIIRFRLWDRGVDGGRESGLRPRPAQGPAQDAGGQGGQVGQTDEAPFFLFLYMLFC